MRTIPTPRIQIHRQIRNRRRATHLNANADAGAATTVATTAAATAAAAAANAQNGDPTNSTASGPGKKSKDSSGTQSDDGTGDTSAAGTSASPDASASAPTPVATVIVVNSAIDTTPGAAANASPSLAIGAQAKARALIATARAAQSGRRHIAKYRRRRECRLSRGQCHDRCRRQYREQCAGRTIAGRARRCRAGRRQFPAGAEPGEFDADARRSQCAQANTATVTAHGAGTTATDGDCRFGVASGRRDESGRNQCADIRYRRGQCHGRHARRRATTAATGATEPTVSLAGLPVAIASRAQAGSSQFDIRLDPPELGRIEVQLSVDSNGQVISHITADRQDTLNLLQSQQPQLQQALEQAGLKTSDSAMQFSLRDQSFAGQQQQNQNFAQNGNNSQSNTQQIVIPDSSLSSVDTTQIYSRLNLRGGLDIRV